MFFVRTTAFFPLRCVFLFATIVNMKPNEIRAALVLRDISIQSIADKCGVKRPSVSMVISRKRHTQHIQEAVARAIEKPVEEVFPPSEEKAA